MSYLGPSLRREKLKERPVRRTGVALLASLAANALLLWALAAAGAFRLAGTKVDSTRVALAPLSASQWEANRKLAAPPPVPRQPPREEPTSGEVVRLPPQQTPEKPAEQKTTSKPRFLAERDQQVERETVSRFAGDYPQLAPRPQLADPERRGAGQDGRARDASKGSERKRGDRKSVV